MGGFCWTSVIAEHFPGPIIYNKEKRNPFSKWNRQNWKAEKLLSYRSAETYWELCFIIRFSDESFLVQAPVLSCWINSRKLFSYKLIRWLETKLCSCIWRWWSSNYRGFQFLAVKIIDVTKLPRATTRAPSINFQEIP